VGACAENQRGERPERGGLPFFETNQKGKRCSRVQVEKNVLGILGRLKEQPTKGGGEFQKKKIREERAIKDSEKELTQALKFFKGGEKEGGS